VIRRSLYAITGVLFLLSSFGLTGYLGTTATTLFAPSTTNLLTLCAAVAGFALLWTLRHRSEILAQYVITYFHELGHGCAAALLGGTPERFVLRLDASGYLAHRTRQNRLVTSAIAFAGYPFPAVVALSGAALHIAGLGQIWILAIAFSAAGIALLAAHNIWAFLGSVLLAALAGYTHLTGSDYLLAVLLGFTVGVLLRGGYESAYEHLLIARDGVPDRSDGAQLGALLPGSASHWARVQLLSIIALTLITFALLCAAAAGMIAPLSYLN
jgi:hypothetical protein